MRIYNTLTRKKEEFVPQEEGKVKMYVCGPTVYNFFHIGNARPFVVFDTMRKYLEYRGYKVKFVQNFTDVDDKIINRAKEEGVSASEVSEKYIEEYFKDAAALNVKKATVHPQATKVIPDIIHFIQDLIDKGFAYESNGDVYFRTRKFDGYGKLSGKNIDDLIEGASARTSEADGEKKEDPLDFALWKARKTDSEIAWESPWGMGRPGWHIECSAMSKKYLGDTLDIHAGGEDLQFPHHENEIAQSETHNGKPFAKYWMHNGYINVDGVKMSKSLGNFKTVRDLLTQYDGEVLRFLILSGHYRGPIDFNPDILEQSQNGLKRMRNCKSALKHLMEAGAEGDMTAEEAKAVANFDTFRRKFIEAMDDDLNTADAISAVFELVTAINTTAGAAGATKAYAGAAMDMLMELAGVLGLLQQDVEEKVEIDPEIQKLIDERQAARKAKDFTRADEIRDRLAAQGITIKDTPQGVQVIRK